jgi:thiamine biosynthesis lipoprotein
MWWNGACAIAERRPAAAVVVALALSTGACQPPAQTHERVIPVFGTFVKAAIAGETTERSEAALDRLEILYHELDVEWRAFGPGELGRVNERLANGESAELSPRLLPLVRRALEIHKLSGGLFDPRVGTLVRLWGFQDLAQEGPATAPEPTALDRARELAIGKAHLHLEGSHLWSEGPVSLELAGIAKGSALAAGAALLRELGVRNAMIVAGGDIVALGRSGDRPWVVGVRDPLKPGVIGRVMLRDGETIASSGTYERNFRSGGRTFHHLLDPRTGYPATGTAGTTVIAADAELANAGAAVLLIGGATRFDELTERLGLEVALLVTEEGQLVTTFGMQRRLEQTTPAP